MLAGELLPDIACLPAEREDVRDLLDAELDAVVAALERSPLIRSAAWSVEATS